jgi:uncharacterized membrane protein YphA (DoxX/SURF4 family)
MNQKVTMVVRILLGVFMLIFGVNKLFPFMPPFEMVGDAKALMGIYVDSGFMTIIGILEALGGLALLIGKYVPLALTILVAILFNAVLFHFFHDMGTIGGALFGLILGLVLVYAHKDRFLSLLSA